MGYARGIRNPAPVPLEGTVSLSATTTITGTGAGKMHYLDSTTSIVVTLPKSTAATKGNQYGFMVRQLTTASGHTVTPATGNTLYFKGAGVAVAANTSAQCSAASDALGDTIVFTDNGDGTLVATITTGTWARV